MKAALAAALGREPGRVLSVLVRSLGDLDLAEEVLQDAAAIALTRWPQDGIPRNPAGWLVTAARRRAIDRLRRAATWQSRERELRLEREIADAERETETIEDTFGDERLGLIFTCCHPSLPLESRVALTLRTVAGLDTAEVARAFLTSEETMKKRLARAKTRIRDAHVPFSVPSDELLGERLGGVLAVLYLIFNEGHGPTKGDAVVRPELSTEAIRLARLVVGGLRDAAASAEARGLLALMLLHDARRDARSGEDGALVLLWDQDRSRFDSEAIAEGARHLEAAAAQGRPGPYQLQAAIAFMHATSARAEDTPWSVIAKLYDRLLALTPTPVVALNRAVAHAMAFGPEAGLDLVDTISGLERYHLFHATRADLLRRLGRWPEAAAAYREALALVTNDRERTYLEARLDACLATASEA